MTTEIGSPVFGRARGLDSLSNYVPKARGGSESDIQIPQPPFAGSISSLIDSSTSQRLNSSTPQPFSPGPEHFVSINDAGESQTLISSLLDLTVSLDLSSPQPLDPSSTKGHRGRQSRLPSFCSVVTSSSSPLPHCEAEPSTQLFFETGKLARAFYGLRPVGPGRFRATHRLEGRAYEIAVIPLAPNELEGLQEGSLFKRLATLADLEAGSTARVVTFWAEKGCGVEELRGDEDEGLRGDKSPSALFVQIEADRGKPLPLVLAEQGLLPSDAFFVFCEVAAALSALRRQGVCHGGRTASSVLIGRDGVSLNCPELSPLSVSSDLTLLCSTLSALIEAAPPSATPRETQAWELAREVLRELEGLRGWGVEGSASGQELCTVVEGMKDWEEGLKGREVEGLRCWGVEGSLLGFARWSHCSLELVDFS